MFNRKNHGTARQTFEAGTYYIGDPCYPFPHEGPHQNLWGHEWCKIMMGEAEHPNAWKKFFEFRGYQVGAACTYIGDGCYDGSDGNQYCVDSGTIGILPIDFVNSISKYDNDRLMELGSIVTFEQPFEVSFEEGLFWFGHIKIDTRPCEDEDDEDDYYGSDDEDEY